MLVAREELVASKVEIVAAENEHYYGAYTGAAADLEQLVVVATRCLNSVIPIISSAKRICRGIEPLTLASEPLRLASKLS